MIGLLPCPFCGSPARINVTQRFEKKVFIVECSKAHPMSHVAKVKNYDKDEAVETWNRRKVAMMEELGIEVDDDV